MKPKLALLYLVVFFSGAAVMTFELLAVRMLAPHYGTSLVVWTAIIGVILGSLSVGHFFGGKIADRSPDFPTLGAVLIAAAVSLSITALSHTQMLSYLEAALPSPTSGASVASLALCALPSLFLAMVTPLAVRLGITDVATCGSVSGRLFAVASIGSIAGTFLTGFYLIPLVGTSWLLALLAVLLLFLSVPCFSSARGTAAMLLFMAGVAFAQYYLTPSPAANVTHEIDTAYSRVWITETTDPESGRRLRNLFFDPYGWQGSIYLEPLSQIEDVPVEWRFSDPTLVIPYTRFFRLAAHFVPYARRILVIGGGIFSVPRDLSKRFPQAAIDVIEIDPELVSIAERHFGFRPDPRIQCKHLDGRAFLNATVDLYDVIIMDAFSSAFAVPFQLTTREAVNHLKRLLAPQGVMLMNIVSAIDGQAGKFLRAEYHTLKEQFPLVKLFPVRNPLDPRVTQNIIIAAFPSATEMAFESGDAELARYLAQRWEKPLAHDIPILTDDFAPVEYYSLAILAESQRFRS